MHSRNKGKRGELELVHKLKEHGLNARRSQQYAGINNDADVICDELASYHLEVKRVQNLNVDKAIDQATRDCGDKTPIVCHRKNNRPWLVTMYLEDFLALIKCQDTTNSK